MWCRAYACVFSCSNKPDRVTDRQTDGQNYRSIVLHCAGVLHIETCTKSFSSSVIYYVVVIVIVKTVLRLSVLCLLRCVDWHVQVCDMECP